MIREAIKAVLSFSWATSLFGMRQLAHAVTSGASVGSSFDRVARAAIAEIEDGERRAPPPLDYDELEAIVRRGASDEDPGPAATPDRAVARQTRDRRGRREIASLAVIGEELAAGMGDFGLSAPSQRFSFPALVAEQLGIPFAQPLFQEPGLGDPVTFAHLPVRVPALMQTLVVESYPNLAPWSNLAIPGFTLKDALTRRPRSPLVHRGDATQTAANLILGWKAMIDGEQGPCATQLEMALRRRASLTIVEIGYHEAVSAALAGDPGLLPELPAWRSDLSRMLRELEDVGSDVVVLSVPDPFDTACAPALDSAGRVLRVTPGTFTALGLDADDRLSVSGLVALAGQLLGATQALPDAWMIPSHVAAAISDRICDLNAELVAEARAHDAPVFDLHGLFREIKARGLTAGPTTLSADYLGGVFGLNGYLPGRTGQAAIANGLLDVLNAAYGTRAAHLDLARVAADDPVTKYRGPSGDLRAEWPAGPSSADRRRADTGRDGAARLDDYGSRRARTSSTLRRHGARGAARLELPRGLRQTLALSPRASYHGDAIRVVNCLDASDAKFGSCGGVLFGGLVMFDSHLRGEIEIQFSEPEGDLARFQIRHGEFAGEDALLAAPQMFRWPVTQCRVVPNRDHVSRGKLNLRTGEVSDLEVAVHYLNSALFALTRVNPHFPDQPIVFPGAYGSAAARFEQRVDGLLDFTFFGSTFLPLGTALGGDPVRWALPFSSPSMEFASVPAAGMAMHPHLHLSTRDPDPGPADADPPDLPPNTIQEWTLFARNSSFGDKFSLNTPELGGTATGRSHIMGRAHVQIGPRFGDAVPVAFSLMGPGGLAGIEPPGPLASVFPGRLSIGPIGHDEFLRFPLRNYMLDGVTLIDDPFDLSVGVVDLSTGVFVNELVHRGFIGQDLFFALVRVEPRTPQSSFFFSGPAVMERGASGQAILRYQGAVRIPYPEGFLFPAPDLTTSFSVGPESLLDPYLWIRAISDGDPRSESMSGEADDQLSSTGERFSYCYCIPADPARGGAVFEYSNTSQNGCFRLHALTWVSFTTSLEARSPGARPDTVTFSGIGTWSKDGGRTPHQVTAQICTAPDASYVSIQIDGGLVSNVNTKPSREEDALP